MEQNRELRNNPLCMAKWFLTRMTRLHNVKRAVSSTNGAGRLITTCKRIELNFHFMPYTKINLKYII